MREVLLGGILLLAACMANAQTARVQTSKPAYAQGEAITVSFSGGPGNAKDWIGIYPNGIKPGSVGSTLWFYVNGTQASTTGLVAGSVTFGSGLANAGAYDVHFLRDDGYGILASASFEIGVSAADSPTPGVAPRWTEIPYLVNNHDPRLTRASRISGDGKKLILMRQPSPAVSGYALTTWLGGFGPKPPTAEDLPEVYLYDIETSAIKPIFTGTQATWQNTNGMHFMSQKMEFVMADLNYDGTRAVVTYIDQRMDYSVQRFAERLTAESVLKLIDTRSGSTLFEKRLPTGSYSSHGVAARLNRDGTKAVFLHYPRGAADNPVFGVAGFSLVPPQIYSLVLAGNAEPAKLSEGEGAAGPKLYDFQLWSVPGPWFQFDLDDAGNRVVFNYAEPKQVIGVNFDGTGRHVISTKTDNAFVSLTRDAEHVVYSFLDRNQTATAGSVSWTYRNTFDGASERAIATTESSYLANGAFIAGEDVKDLAYSHPGGGAYFLRPLGPNKSDVMLGHLMDASDDLQVVLTKVVIGQFTGESTFYLNRFEVDADNDDLGDEWERRNFGNLDQGWWSDADGDSVKNGEEYQYFGTDPKNKDSDGDGLNDYTEVVRTGTNPNDAKSGLAVNQLAVSEGKVRFQWGTVPGKSYRVQAASALGSAGMWQNISDPIKGDGKAAEFNAPASTQTKFQFYRLVLE